MKRIFLIIVFAVILLGVGAATAFKTWMEQSVKSNIELQLLNSVKMKK